MTYVMLVISMIRKQPLLLMKNKQRKNHDDDEGREEYEKLNKMSKIWPEN